jgi:cholesterol transport system auxiliary component
MSLFTIDLIADRTRIDWAKGLFCTVFGAFLLSGCSALPDKPVRAVLYDFGPGELTYKPTTRQAPLAALAIDDISTPGGALDNQAVLYRLTYQNAQELRPYTLARWAAPPAQLVRQRLREQLGQQRPILEARGGLALSRSESTVRPLLLRLDLEEFSQVFTSPQASAGLIRVRATLIEQALGGEKLIAQRTIVVKQPAPSADAQGGVKALTAATDAAIGEIDVWLQQSTPR